jgi:hypothetical protein
MALIDKASLLFVPSVVAEGKAFNILPSGNRAPDSTDQNSGYDQTRADFDFDRGSNAAATRVNADGLIEKYRENKLLYSQDYTQSNWNKTNCTITSNYIANPVDGSVNAPNITIDQTAGSYEKTMTQQNLNFVSGNVYCVSVWMKAGSVSSDTLRILAYDGGQVHSSSYIYLDDIENTPCKYEAGDNGWNRFYFYFKASNTAAGYIYIFNYAYGQVTNAGTNLYLYGAQWELGTYPTDYLDSTSVTGKAGVLVDLPRINYDANGENGALLLEPSRQQLIQFSEYITGFGTSNTGVTIEENATTSPEGVVNAAKIKEDATNAAHAVRQLAGPTLTSGTDYTFSFFAKKGERNIVALSNTIGASNAANCFFDLENGQVLTNQFNSASIEDFGNGWYRCIATDTADAADDYDTRIYTATADNQFSHQGVSGSGLYIYGIQLEAGSYPSSYIPNHGESGGVTRALDVCDLNGMNAAGISTSNNWTYFFDIDNFEAGTNGFYLYSTSGEILHLFSTSVGYRNTSNSTNYVGSWSLSSYNGNNSQVKMIFRYDGDKLVAFINGVKKDEVDSSLVSARFADPFNRDRFHWAGNSKWDTNKKIFFNQALTDAECITLTTL